MRCISLPNGGVCVRQTVAGSEERRLEVVTYCFPAVDDGTESVATTALLGLLVGCCAFVLEFLELGAVG